MSVYEKLLIVQSELKAPKNQYNGFGKYKYRSCEDILESVKPLLVKVKATLNISDEILLIGQRYYIKATAKFSDSENGVTIENVAYAREEETKKGMDSSQITGSASSYARKYALNGLFCIDDVKDSDATNTGDDKKVSNYKATKSQHQIQPKTESEMDVEQEKIAGQKIGQTKIEVIKKELERTGVVEKAICSRYKVAKIDDITEEVFIRVLNALKKTKSKEV